MKTTGNSRPENRATAYNTAGRKRAHSAESGINRRSATPIKMSSNGTQHTTPSLTSTRATGSQAISITKVPSSNLASKQSTKGSQQSASCTKATNTAFPRSALLSGVSRDKLCEELFTKQECMTDKDLIIMMTDYCLKYIRTATPEQLRNNNDKIQNMVAMVLKMNIQETLKHIDKLTMASLEEASHENRHLVANIERLYNHEALQDTLDAHGPRNLFLMFTTCFAKIQNVTEEQKQQFWKCLSIVRKTRFTNDLHMVAFLRKVYANPAYRKNLNIIKRDDFEKIEYAHFLKSESLEVLRDNSGSINALKVLCNTLPYFKQFMKIVKQLQEIGELSNDEFRELTSKSERFMKTILLRQTHNSITPRNQWLEANKPITPEEFLIDDYRWSIPENLAKPLTTLIDEYFKETLFLTRPENLNKPIKLELYNRLCAHINLRRGIVDLPEDFTTKLIATVTAVKKQLTEGGITHIPEWNDHTETSF